MDMKSLGGVNAKPQMSYVLSCRCKATRGKRGLVGGGPLMSEVTKSLHKLSHVRRETRCVGGSRENGDEVAVLS